MCKTTESWSPNFSIDIICANVPPLATTNLPSAARLTLAFLAIEPPTKSLATVPFLYDERALETDFTVTKGMIGRGFILEKGDIITIAKDLVGGSVEKNAKVNLAADGKLVVAGAGTFAQIIAVEKFGDQDSVVLHIL